MKKKYFLSSHQPISTTGLDKLAIHSSIFGPDSKVVMKTAASSLLPTGLRLACLFVRHNILSKRGHQDELKQFSCIILYCLKETIKFNICLLIVQNIAAIASGTMKIYLPYEMITTCIFKYFKVPLDGVTSLKSTPFDELTFEGMGNEIVHSYSRGSKDED